MSNNTKTPIHDSYWVVPGRLLAGEYPGALNESVARRKVRSFVEAGISMFLDLTENEELEPYEHFLTEDSVYVRKAIRDMSVPTPELMKEIQELIALSLAQNHVVYVHCMGGIGRTGTVVGCYLVEQGMTGEAALLTIRDLRKSVSDSGIRSPETHDQRTFVQNWRTQTQLV